MIDMKRLSLSPVQCKYKHTLFVIFQLNIHFFLFSTRSSGIEAGCAPRAPTARDSISEE